jgi:ATP-dependent DNA helicase DinG
LYFPSTTQSTGFDSAAMSLWVRATSETSGERGLGTVEARPQQTTSRSRLVNRDLNPLLRTLPPQFQRFRPEQIRAVDETIRAFERGAKVVVLDAPTGSGKTLIGETVRRMAEVRSGVYVCSDRSLQTQFNRDFPYSRVLMGRSNYPTVLFRDRWEPGSVGSISAEDCTKTSTSPCMLCPTKHDCPYEIAKHEALSSFLPVLNTAYALTEWNGPGRFSGRGLAIMDEADLLEGAMMGYVSVEVSERRMRRYEWTAPKITVEASWREWAEEHSRLAGDMAEKYEGRALDTREAREYRYLTGLATNLARVARDIAAGDSPWVYDGNRERVSFKPSRVRSFGPALWSHADRWLLMSASIVSAGEVLWSLGGEGMVWESVTLGSSFPVKNRLVHVKPVGDMSRKRGGQDDGLVVASIRRILFTHPVDRILIHTVSYDRAGTLVRVLRALFPGRRIFAYTTANSRPSALAAFTTTPGSVLVGPSLDRGVDLPGDLCRVQIITKVPYPNLGDKVVNARYHSGREGKTWYTVQTVRSLVQMTGRAVRSEDDWADTWILDRNFGERLWSGGGRDMFPEWWRDALVWERAESKAESKGVRR